MRVGSLFAGIGGFDLGLERAGMTVQWQVEIDPFCRRVLAKHWPDVRRYEDVREVHAARVCPSGGVCDRCLPDVDVLCGGFPCQDISVAGRGDGIDGARSGLWAHYARLVGELRPRVVFVENVSALLSRGLGRVLGDLAACGYDAEWDCISAASVGANHQRDRLWIVAHANSVRELQPEGRESNQRRWISDSRQTMADASGRVRQREAQGQSRHATFGSEGIIQSDWWLVEPDVGRVAHGVSARVDRLKGLGNAVVPQITEWIGRRILEAHA